MSALADPGASNERTALAWQRTGLALVTGSAILTRLTFDRLGLLAFASLVIAMPIGLWLFIESRGRYSHDAGGIQRLRGRGGRAGATLTLATTILGFAELTALLLG